MTSTVVLVGGSQGLGLAAARLLAASGRRVIATGRDLSAFTDADRQAGIEPVALDLGALSNIDGFVAGLGERGVERVDVLLGNAGAQSRDRRWTADGYEMTVGVNHLAAVRLVDRIAPLMPAGGRVVLTASGTHNPDEVKNVPPALEEATLDELLHPDAPAGMRDGLQRYATSKLLMVRCVPFLARALAEQGITVNAFDPGLMPGTGLARDQGGLAQALFRVLTPLLLLAPGAHRVSTSARHLADLATSPRYERMSGAYVVDDLPSGTSIASHDLAAGQRLYDDTLRVIEATTLSGH